MMTIDQLARAGRTTTRNVRAYQSKGLLKPPIIKGRVGYYDDEHLNRLKLISRMQSRGFSLASIASLIEAQEENKGISEVLGFEQALRAPWTAKDQVLSKEEFFERYPHLRDDGLLDRACEHQIVAREGENLRILNEQLLAVGKELSDNGIPVSASLDELEALEKDLGRVAERFVRMFEVHVWKPFAKAGMPMERFPEITSALERTKPLGLQSVAGVLAQQMERAVNAAAERQIAAAQKRKH